MKYNNKLRTETVNGKIRKLGQVVLNKVDEVCDKEVFLRSKVVDGGYSAEWSFDGSRWTTLGKPYSSPEYAISLARTGAYLAQLHKRMNKGI